MTQQPDYGPGLTWLAERSGTTPQALLADRRRLADAAVAALGDASGLLARLGSADPAERLDAEHRAAAIRDRFAGSEDPAERFGERLAVALRDAAGRVRGA